MKLSVVSAPRELVKLMSYLEEHNLMPAFWGLLIDGQGHTIEGMDWLTAARITKLKYERGGSKT